MQHKAVLEEHWGHHLIQVKKGPVMDNLTGFCWQHLLAPSWGVHILAQAWLSLIPVIYEGKDVKHLRANCSQAVQWLEGLNPYCPENPDRKPRGLKMEVLSHWRSPKNHSTTHFKCHEMAAIKKKLIPAFEFHIMMVDVKNTRKMGIICFFNYVWNDSQMNCHSTQNRNTFQFWYQNNCWWRNR